MSQDDWQTVVTRRELVAEQKVERKDSKELNFKERQKPIRHYALEFCLEGAANPVSSAAEPELYRALVGAVMVAQELCYIDLRFASDTKSWF